MFQIKNRWSGAVQFECELSAEVAGQSYSLQLGFAIKKGLEAGADLVGAYLAGADLTGAYLTGADLAGANLAGAYLAGADLTRAYLTGADLTRADLAGAYLARANLVGADLTGADLARANLVGADLAGAKWRDGITIQRQPLQIYGLRWPVTILDQHMQIGCELHALAEWAQFDDARIVRMDGRDALKFWRTHKNALLTTAKSDNRV